MPSKLDNLKPFTSEQSHEEAVKNGQKGGIASGKARRDKKMLKDCLEILLEKQHETEIDGKTVTMSGVELLSVTAFEEALKGNPKWWELVRDTVGQKPVEKVVVSEIDTDVMDEVEKMMNDD